MLFHKNIQAYLWAQQVYSQETIPLQKIKDWLKQKESNETIAREQGKLNIMHVKNYTPGRIT